LGGEVGALPARRGLPRGPVGRIPEPVSSRDGSGEGGLDQRADPLGDHVLSVLYAALRFGAVAFDRRLDPASATGELALDPAASAAHSGPGLATRGWATSLEPVQLAHD